MAIIISIEGNIGAGKSTLLKQLKQFALEKKCLPQPIVFMKEPLDEWLSIKDDNNTHILEHFYANPSKWAFSFQMMAYISRAKILRDLVRKHPQAIIVTERSLETDKNVFAAMLHQDGLICDIDYQIYNKWFDEFSKGIEVRRIMYLRTTPETCSKRITKRNRKGETISLKYLSQCHTFHEKWLESSQVPRVTIDCDKNKQRWGEDELGEVFQTILTLSGNNRDKQ
jgi:deoxyadenosine/deoxycytidine kinase